MKFPFVLLIVVSAMSCQFQDSDRAKFYQSKTDEDLKRIPLIKPYEIINGTGDYWQVNYFYFDKNQPLDDVQRVDSFTIADSVIVIECNNCAYHLNIHKKHYTVIIPKSKIEMTFLEEDTFNQYLQRSNIKLG